MGFMASWGNQAPNIAPHNITHPSKIELFKMQFRGSVLTRAFPVASLSTSISIICILLRRGYFGDNAGWMISQIEHPMGVQVFGIMFAFLITNRVGRSIERRWEGMTVISQMYLKWYDAYAFIMSYVKKDLQILVLRKRNPDLPQDKKDALDEKVGQLECFRDKVTHWFSLMNALGLATVKHGEGGARSEIHKCPKDIQWLPKPEPSPSRGSKMEVIRRSFSGGHELANRLEYLGQILSAEDEQLEAVEDKPLHVMQWICDALVLADEESLISIPSPLMAQLFMELQHGVQQYQEAYRIAAVPYPFPMAQMIGFMMTIFVCVTPIVIENFTRGWMLTPILTCLTTLCYWGLNAVAIELENPFGEDANDLPLHELCATMNERILELGCSHVQDSLDTVHGFSNMFTKEQLPYNNVAGFEHLVHHAHPVPVHHSPGKPNNVAEPQTPKSPKKSPKGSPKSDTSRPIKESSAKGNNLQEQDGGCEEPTSQYKLKPYIERGAAYYKGKQTSEIAHAKDFGDENFSDKEDPKTQLYPVAISSQKPIHRTAPIAGSSRLETSNSQAGTGECDTPAASESSGPAASGRIRLVAHGSASESINSINPSATSVLESSPDVGPHVLALAQQSHKTEALLQHSAYLHARLPGELPPASTSASQIAMDDWRARDAQRQRPMRPLHGGTNEQTYALWSQSQSSAVGAEQQRIAEENMVVPAHLTSTSHVVASSGSGHSSRASPYLAPGSYEVGMAGDHDHQPHLIVATGEQATVPVPQQSPRTMYIMLPRVQRRVHATGGYTSGQNLAAAPQQVVAQYQYAMDDLC